MSAALDARSEVVALSRTEPVTVTVARRVAAGREREFEDWYDGIIAAAGRMPGFLGGGVLRPHTAGHDWHVVYRFAGPDDLLRWESSTERAEWSTGKTRAARASRLSIVWPVPQPASRTVSVGTRRNASCTAASSTARA